MITAALLFWRICILSSHTYWLAKDYILEAFSYVNAIISVYLKYMRSESPADYELRAVIYFLNIKDIG